MRKSSLRWPREGILTALLISVAVICLCLFAGDYCARAEEPLPDPTAPPQPLAFALPYLQQNPDTVGWLKVGNIIDTPVVQGEGDFYLHHSFSGAESSAGTVFLDEECPIFPKGEHLLLYGHNMRNGTMFGELDRYRDLSFLKANSVITFDTIYEEGKYVVVAVFDISGETEDRHFMQMLRFNFVDNEDFMTFYFDARWKSYFKIPVDVRYGDKLLTLITCSYSLYDGRLIVMLREIRPDEDPQEIVALMQSTESKK